MTTTPNQDDAEEVRREHFNAWYAGQAMPDLLARIDPQQAAHNAFEEGVRFAAQPQAAPQPEAVAPEMPQDAIINLTQAIGKCGATRVHELHGDTLTIFKDAELFEFVRKCREWRAPHPTGGKQE